MILFGGILLFSTGCKPRKNIVNDAGAASTSNAFDDYFIDAITHYNNANYVMSLKLLDKCMKLKPEQAAPYYYASKIKIQEDYKSAQGLQYASKAYDLANSNLEYARWYAYLLKLFNKIDEAISVLENNLKLNPGNENIVVELDKLYSRNSLIDKQISLWQNLMKDKGFSLKYANRLVALYKSDKDFAAAHKIYEQIESAAPKKYQYIVENGKLYLDEGLSAQAFECFERALKVNPNIWEVNNSLFNYYFEKNDSSKALQFLSQGLSDPRTSYQIKHPTIVKIKLQAENDSNMAIYLRVVGNVIKKLYQDDAQATSMGAYCFEYLKEYSDALALYRRTIQYNSNYTAYLGLIRLEQKANGPSAALNAVDSAIELYPNVSDLYAIGSDIAFNDKRYQQSIEYAQNGLRYSIEQSGKVRLYTCMINAYLGSGDFAKALESVNSAIKLMPDNPLLIELLGDVRLRSGALKEAEEAWRKAIDMGGDKDKLNKKIREINENK